MALPIIALRVAVKAAQKLASKKVSRLKSKGVNVAGTQYDPRRDIKKIGGYNRKQLESYLGQLEKFKSRSTSFHAGTDGAVIPGDKWRAYKRAERLNNQRAKRAYDKMAGRMTLESGMTVAEHDKLFRPSRRSAVGQASNRTYDFVNRKPINIPSVKALEKLTKSLEKKLSPGYANKVIKRNRRTLEKMLEPFGNPDLKKKLDKLTDKQFRSLWEYGEFASKTGLRYTQKVYAAGKGDFIADDSGDDIGELLDWAASFPTHG